MWEADATNEMVKSVAKAFEMLDEAMGVEAPSLLDPMDEAKEARIMEEGE